MRSRARSIALYCAAGAVALVVPCASQGQAKSGAGAPATDTARAASLPPAESIAGRLTGAAEVGLRTFTGSLTDQQRGKFEEYRDVPSGLLLQHLVLFYTPADSFRSFRLQASNVGLRDQTIAFRAKQPGLFDFQLGWDRIPHTFSTDARSLYTETDRGIYTLPVPRPDTAAFNRAPFIAPVRSLWEPVKLALGITPSQAWDFKAEYTHIGRNGDRPMGQAFGSPGAGTSEILEPIDQTIHDLKITQSYAEDRFQLVGTYDLSVFQNNVKSVTADNPMLTTDTPTLGSSRGRTALAPNNLAHTIVVNGGLNFPWRTRVTGNAALSWWRQDEPFVPVTINSAIVDPRIAQVPASLDGSVRTTNLAASVTSRPLAALALSARYRSYQYRDEAGVSALPLIVVNDRTVSPADTARRDPFARRNADVSGTWQLLEPLSLTVGLGWEQMERDSAERNVLRTSERTPRVSVDYTGVSWLSLRGMYSKGWRRGSTYVQSTGENPDTRRFDEADRDRERTSLIASVTPIDPVTITGTWQVGHDLYPDALFGVQSDRSTAVGADASFAIGDRITGGAGLMRETFDDLMKARYRTGTQLNNVTYDWIGNNTDVVNTASLDLHAVLIPERLEAGGSIERSRARYAMATYNPVAPTGGTAAQNASATAVDLPEVTQTMQPLGTYLRYHFRPDWAFTVRYHAERYTQNDYKTNGLVPATAVSATNLQLYLANYFQDYDARYFTFSFTYRPQAIRIGRSIL